MSVTRKNTDAPKVFKVCHRVLNTPELLEMILLQLPMKSLLQAKRINATFNDAIETSPTIQMALFMRAKSEDSLQQKLGFISVAAELSKDKVKYPPGMRFNSIRDAKKTVEHQETVYVSHDALGVSHEVHENPAVTHIFPRILFLSYGYDYGATVHLPTLQDNKASWRQMYVTLPPVRELLVGPGYRTTDGGRRVLVAANGIGVTIGEVAEAVLSWPNKNVGRKDRVTAFMDGRVCWKRSEE